MVLYQLNDLFSDSAVIQCVVDIFAGAGFVRRVMNGDVNDYILAIGNFFFLDTNEGAQA